MSDVPVGIPLVSIYQSEYDMLKDAQQQLSALRTAAVEAHAAMTWPADALDTQKIQRAYAILGHALWPDLVAKCATCGDSEVVVTPDGTRVCPDCWGKPV